MNKIKSYILFLILLTMLSPATFGMAQTIIVKDSITHETVPFVSVNFGNDSGGYTDEQGAIAIPSEIEQIRFSHICYESKSPHIRMKRHRTFIKAGHLLPNSV